MTMLSTFVKGRIRSNPGSKIMYKYVRQVDKSGRPKLIVKEKFNIYNDIQSYKDDNTIEKILAKVGGDISKLDFNKGVYMDVSQIPDSYTDLYNMTQQIADDYRSLPVKYKQALENNPNIYYGLAMSGKIKDFIAAIDAKDVVDSKGMSGSDKAKAMISPDNFNFKKSDVDNKFDNSSEGGNSNV